MILGTRTKHAISIVSQRTSFVSSSFANRWRFPTLSLGFFCAVVDRTVVERRKKKKTLQAGWDLSWGSFLAASHSKGGTAAKSSQFGEVIQGWPLKACSAFSVPAGLRSQMPCAFFFFFLCQLPRRP